MSINGIGKIHSSILDYNSSLNNKKSEEKKTFSHFEDKLDISMEARKVANVDNSREAFLEKVKHKISSGFYDQKDVINNVADSILESDDLKSF
jgi:hypothetical protein